MTEKIDTYSFLPADTRSYNADTLLLNMLGGNRNFLSPCNSIPKGTLCIGGLLVEGLIPSKQYQIACQIKKNGTIIIEKSRYPVNSDLNGVLYICLLASGSNYKIISLLDDWNQTNVGSALNIFDTPGAKYEILWAWST